MSIPSRVPLAVVAVAMGCLVAHAQVGETEASLSLYASVKNDLLRRALYTRPERLVSGVAPDGAVSVNEDWQRGRRPTWFIEQQRYGADLVQAGLVLKDRPLVEEGWKILAWGFARQGPDGGFPGTGDPFHSTSLFVEAAARALLLQRQSGNEHAAIGASQYQSKVAAAAHWLLRQDVAARGRKNNRPYAHRRWLLAAALGETAALTGDHQMALAAADYAREGLALQTPQGVNPEKGGADANYQAFGILLAARYYTVCPDATLRAEIKNRIDRGLRWELTRLDANGNISLEGNSRTGKETGRSGRPKTIDYKSLLQAFVFGAAITRDARYQRAAERIALRRKWIKS